MSGNLKSQVTSIPSYKSTGETTYNTNEFSANNIFEYTSTQKQNLKSVSIQNIVLTPNKKIYNYSVAERKQDKKNTQAELNLFNITSKFGNKDASESSANFNQPILASKSHSSTTYNEQQVPFQELNKTDNQQSMQKVGPTGNPGDPGLIPIGDGIVLLILALGCYTIFKFKNL